MSKVLVTGGAGFIGRWVVKKLLEDEHDVWVLDNLSNSDKANLGAFFPHPRFRSFVQGSILDKKLLKQLFQHSFDLCYHLAASINVQDSIDHPTEVFANDTIGTFNVLEQCRQYQVKLVFMSTCMVYAQAFGGQGITETNPIKPASPYAGSKIAAEQMVLSYYYTYGLPTVVVRPFNTYGPYQKSNGEGGVVAIFLKKKLAGELLQIYGNGTQTRDLLFVEDCARFVVLCGYADQVNGEIIHAGLGKDISINDLALKMVQDKSRIKHMKHIHPQSEIAKLLCNYEKADRLLGWRPQVSLEEGIHRTEVWMRSVNDAP